LENNTIEVARRDTKEKVSVSLDIVVAYVEQLLEDIQQNLYRRALNFREEHTTFVDNFDDFKSVLETKGGFLMCHWDGSSETEEKIKEATKATIRCIPVDAEEEEGKCVYSGQPSHRRVVFAKAY
jgi:prolyl-tRNA synthetase